MLLAKCRNLVACNAKILIHRTIPKAPDKVDMTKYVAFA